MAGEEDVELRDLVAQTLETKGVLGKIRAQLRASVFLALEERDSETKPHPLASSKLAEFLKTKDGQITTALVREFLEFFELDYSCAVFDPESNALESYPGREKLAQDLSIGSEASTSTPLLASILQKSRHIPPSAEHKQLSFPEQAIDHIRTASSAHPPNRRPVDDSQFTIPLNQGKLGPLRENDINSTFTPTLQPNSLNTNENSNLHLGTQASSINGLGESRNLADLSLASLEERGAHAELGDTFTTGNGSLDVDNLLNSTEDLDKVAQLASVKTVRDELGDFFDNIPLSAKSNPSLYEDSSAPLSSIMGKFETEDMTLSENSVPEDFDYSEQVS